ncbi:prolipoprotein diacylglyceryl transferase [Candidatus Pelagibacter sp.]|jgi:phosphatidylglycerol:prolipoprotein diacylglycerol transferase|nr:prolipoprotein diacylglyceryl transferase [Candidatus Pelagibacter sp.]MDA9641841.1 prolipoprotein diacylglyceryl transferase [bacterium]MDB4153969.1 prolipoprotein diacylglyceryl transferase [Candidatus Pelagibacter sp.]MDC0350549.1 prolipoprotein diacylglyceryl transferase [Candidatus Pelagibacter sp.]
MFINNFDPVAFQIMSFEIRWYSLAYIAGIIIGWLLCKKILIQKSDINEKFDDYITYLVIGMIIGGRLGYIIFYNFSYYINNFFDIFKVWEGGMSFHGGLIGIIIASILFTKKHNQDSFLYMDLVSLVAPIGIFFGRLANFINSELYGTPTDIPWAVTFIQVDNLSRHPSQLYEAILEGIILFIILMYFKNKDYLKKPGLISGLFLIFYSIFRFFIEFVRVPDEQLGHLIFELSMGQIISLIFFVIGIILFYLKNENKQTY